MRADGSLAKGDRQRVLLEAEGVPFRGARVDMRACEDPRLRCGFSARYACRPSRAGSTSFTARSSARCRRSATCGVGLLHLLIRHTSASLTLKENADPSVRRDFETWFDQAVPEDAPYWTHTLEGSDDMPAHIKASLLGPTLTLPIVRGRLALGTWQGIYLCEHRDSGGLALARGDAVGRDMRAFAP